MKVYGIPNCDITKKAMSWLKKNRLGFEFHDYKVSGISAEKLNEWAKKTDWKKFFNKKSTTWRSLSPLEQAKASTLDGAIQLMQEYNSIIKRPIIEHKGKILIGFDETEFKKELI